MKRMSAIIVCASLVAAFALAWPARTGEKPLRIGASFYGLTVEILGQIRERMDECLKDGTITDKVDLVVLDAQYDAIKQNDQVYNLISQRMDAIIIVPFDREQQVPAIEASIEAGIPIIELCASTVSPQRTSYVGSEDFVSGQLLAKELLRLAGGKGNIIVLHGVAGQNAQVMRNAGLEDVLNSFPDAKVIADKVTDWERAKALAATENFIQSGLDFNIVFAQNDEIAMGALIALENAGRREGVYLGGVDGLLDALEAVKDGRMDCTVFQNGAAQAETVMKVAIQAARGEKVEPLYDIPYELVTPDNVDEYLKRIKK